MGYTGIMEEKMETTVLYQGLRRDKRTCAPFGCCRDEVADTRVDGEFPAKLRLPPSPKLRAPVNQALDPHYRVKGLGYRNNVLVSAFMSIIPVQPSYNLCYNIIVPSLFFHFPI